MISGKQEEFSFVHYKSDEPERMSCVWVQKIHKVVSCNHVVDASGILFWGSWPPFWNWVFRRCLYSLCFICSVKPRGLNSCILLKLWKLSFVIFIALE